LETLKKLEASKPMLIFEQKYKIYDKNGLHVLNEKDFSEQQQTATTSKSNKSDLHYCSVGADRASGRPLAERHFKACLTGER
jgi:hypothetical protein